MPKTIDEQIRSVERELAMRKGVYKKRVEIRAMTQEQADHEIECMKAVRETLEQVRQSPRLL
jgi:hypothetical protein